MISFGGSPRTARMKAAYISISQPAYGGVIIGITERGHRGGKHEAGILLTDEVRHELIQALGGVIDAEES